MKVIIDTSIWSLYFRRKREGKTEIINTFRDLLIDGRVILPGIVKQELLSGIREKERFEKLLTVLSGFDPLLASDNDHILAADFFNLCRNKGVQGSFADFLICAQAYNNKMCILSSDCDFQNYKKIIPISLF